MTSPDVSRSDRIRRLSRDRLKIRLRRSRPLLVWLLVLSVALVLYARREGGIVVAGVAEEIRYEVASTTDGRLDALHVIRNQAVTRGQMVASLDAEALRLELREARAELSRLTAELASETLLLAEDIEGRRLDRQVDLRRFARDVEGAHVDYLDALAGLAEDRIELQGLEIELERTSRLHESELTSADQYDEDRIACEALRASVAEQTDLVEALELGYEHARTRRDAQLSVYKEQSLELSALLEPHEYAIEVQGVRIEKVNLAINGRLLRAPADGIVTDVVARAGEVIAAGQPVVTIVEPCARKAIAYLPEDRVLDVQPGDEVRVRRVADRGRGLRSTVAALDAGLCSVPDRLVPSPGVASWGRAVYVALPSELAIRPGEALEVAF